MITLTVKNNFEGVEGDLGGIFRKELPFVASKTMNQAMSSAKKAVIHAMPKHIEGGATRWTRNGMRVDWSKKTKLRGGIYFKEDRAYMQEIMHGGTKRAARKKLIEPVMANIKSRAELNKFGNVPRSLRNKAFGDASNRYFVGIPSGMPRNEGLLGIWRREGRKGRGGLTMIASLKRSQRKQRITFPAPEIAEKAFMKRWRRSFGRNFLAAVASSRGFVQVDR